MFLKKHWLFFTFLIVAICGVSLYLLHINTPKETVKIYKPVELLEKPTAEAPVGDTSQGGHFHADGDPGHEGPHAEVAETPSEPPTAVMPDWNSLTDEQREQLEKEQNQLLIDTIASKPIFAEVYQLMTENEYPYSPEVEAQIQAATWRVSEKADAENARIQAEHKRLAAIIAKQEREIARNDAINR